MANCFGAVHAGRQLEGFRAVLGFYWGYILNGKENGNIFGFWVLGLVAAQGSGFRVQGIRVSSPMMGDQMAEKMEMEWRMGFYSGL